MKRFVLSLMSILLIAACGSGDSGGSLQESSQDRSRGGQQLNTDAIETTDTFSFDTRMVENSLVEQQPLEISGRLKNASGTTHAIGSLDDLKRFNDLLPDNRRIVFEDLATHTYFLVPASGCPAYSRPAGVGYGRDQVTIRITRFMPNENAACIAAIVTSFHVFKGEKVREPQIPFESLTHQAHSYIDNERLEVIRDASAWTALWAEHHRGYSPAPVLPYINFTENMVVAVYIGTRPNGCYSVGIDRIYRSDEATVVEYTERTPAAGDICTLALTSPSHLVVIPRTPYPFEFRKTMRIR